MVSPRSLSNLDFVYIVWGSYVCSDYHLDSDQVVDSARFVYFMPSGTNIVDLQCLLLMSITLCEHTNASMHHVSHS
jgi:hypothetical protein